MDRLLTTFVFALLAFSSLADALTRIRQIPTAIEADPTPGWLVIMADLETND
jgi:hypothetical protein